MHLSLLDKSLYVGPNEKLLTNPGATISFTGQTHTDLPLALATCLPATLTQPVFQVDATVCSGKLGQGHIRCVPFSILVCAEKSKPHFKDIYCFETIKTSDLTVSAKQVH